MLMQVLLNKEDTYEVEYAKGAGEKPERKERCND